MAKLFLLRHLKSQWNEDNRFAGWTDGPLAKNSAQDAWNVAQEIFQHRIDVCYSASLFRVLDTLARIYECNGKLYPFFIHIDGGKMQKWGNFTDLSQNDTPVYVTEKLNERYYGKLQGLNKKETIKKFGEKKVHLWRRSYNVAPPGGESMADVYKRAAPFYKRYIEKDLMAHKNVLVVASHNSLRAITKYVENIPDKEIINLELPFGALVKYEFDGKKYLKYN